MSDQIVINAKVGGNIVLPPAGNHIAICCGMVVLGTQEETYEGHVKKQLKIQLWFELCEKMHVFDEKKGPEPFIVRKEYTLSMNAKASFRKMLESWRCSAFTNKEAETFNIALLLGSACRLNVIIKKSGAGNDYSDIASISMVGDNDVIPEKGFYPQTIFTLNAPFQKETFNTLPTWIQDKIKKSDEYKSFENPNASDAAPDTQATPTVKKGKMPF